MFLGLELVLVPLAEGIEGSIEILATSIFFRLFLVLCCLSISKSSGTLSEVVRVLRF